MRYRVIFYRGLGEGLFAIITPHHTVRLRGRGLATTSQFVVFFNCLRPRYGNLHKQKEYVIKRRSSIPYVNAFYSFISLEEGKFFDRLSILDRLENGFFRP